MEEREKWEAGEEELPAIFSKRAIAVCHSNFLTFRLFPNLQPFLLE
jgi:hypothetical protein